MKIGVLGAGVVGLNTALEIQRQFPNVDVTVIAEKFNEETTSDGSAGLFSPMLNFKGPNIEVEKQWVLDSFKYYQYLMKTENCHITPISGYNLSNVSQDECESELLKVAIPEYRSATDSEKNYCDIKFKYGTFISTFVIPCRKLLPWSLEKFQRDGGRIRKEKINNIDVLSETYDILFNCSGLNSRYLFNDLEIIPARGQVIQVTAPWVQNWYKWDNGSSYILPCGFDNMVTLGGTRNYGNFSTEINKNDSKSIMDRCCQIDPKLRTASVVREWVGLRPYRPTLRVGIEKRNNFIIIHNYGHGGTGVTSSPGTAKYSVQLLKEYHLVGRIFTS